MACHHAEKAGADGTIGVGTVVVGTQLDQEPDHVDLTFPDRPVQGSVVFIVCSKKK
jgi:hypothetical protein